MCFQVDDRRLGWLSAEDTMIALRVINRSLTDAEEHYITRVCVFLYQPTARYVKNISQKGHAISSILIAKMAI